jgi:uncharacterized protein (DUF2126 family)
MLHPAIAPHIPLHFDLIDTWHNVSLGGCLYTVNDSHGQPYTRLPQDATEAAHRMAERIQPQPPQPSPERIPSLTSNLDYPMTLDLRRYP